MLPSHLGSRRAGGSENILSTVCMYVYVGMYIMSICAA